jgi:uncharacterized protein (DUF885 family)
MTRSLVAVLLVLEVLVRGPAARAQERAPRTTFHERFLALAARPAMSDSARLHALFALDWESTHVESPETATLTGYPGQDDRWTDYSVAALARRRRDLADPVTVLRAIDRRRLDAADRESYDIFARDAREALDGARFPSELLALSQLGGPQYLSNVIARMPTDSAADYERILARLRALPELLRQTRILLDSGAAIGVTPPRVTLRDVPAQLEALVPDDAFRSPLLAPFARVPATVDPADRVHLAAAAERVYSDSVRPAYRRFAAYVRERYVPRARESIAWSALPDGRAWYAYLVRVATTTDRTPAQLHRLGKHEVKRLRAEMERAMRETGYQGDFASFVAMLHADPRFTVRDSASLVRRYREIVARIEPGLPTLFGRLPHLPLVVEAVPSHVAASQPTAYYVSGSPDAHRPGTFYVNTSRLDTRPTWEMEALTAHEAVPGHHLQISLAQELTGLPEFRRYGGYPAFTEGWALYAEGLGYELGLYRDPYSRFGQLSYEMWRAIRLVLDTGIHDEGWSREQAIAYFVANSAKSRPEIESEVDRYLANPAQALSYETGALTIRALRADAERRLGSRFDPRAFHDRLLGAGAIPMDVLTERMREWTAQLLTAAVGSS